MADIQHENTEEKKPSCLKRFSNGIIGTLEKAFYWIGYAIGKYPWAFMLADLVLVAICLPGIFLFFTQESRQEKLWTPDNSQAILDKAWVDDKFPTNARIQQVIISDTNVLTPAVLQGILDLDIAVKNITGSGEFSYDWDSLCARLGSPCWSNSLLELWSFNATIIRSLSQQQILDEVNSATTSPVYFTKWNATSVLGEISRDSSGDITGAGGTIMFYAVKQNETLGADDPTAKDWELAFLKIMENGHKDINSVDYFSIRSFGDEAGASIFGDVNLLSVGYFIIIIFVAMVLGYFNQVQHRIYMTFGGIFCVGFAIIVSFGICSYAGVFYGPVNSILPFLVLGIGVDDMFVIVQSLDNLGADIKDKPVHEKIAHTMKHAGVAITVTSLTDILAFGIGATTFLPALRSFCIYAFIGILFTYMFQATFFVACLTYDQRRVEGSRNACCCCIVHRDYEPNTCSKKSYMQLFFEKVYSKYLLKLPAKIVVCVVSAGFLGVCIWGTISLKQEFDPAWFLPSDGYAAQFFKTSEKYFPENDVVANVYLGDIDYYGNFTQLRNLHTAMDKDEYVFDGSVDSWFYSFDEWMKSSTSPAVTALTNADGFASSESNFYTLLNMYMFAPPYQGMKYSRDIKRNTTSNVVTASRFSLTHIDLKSSREEIDAMKSARGVAASSGFDHQDCFVYSRFYLGFETNDVIEMELYRNLGLAFLCVVIMTLILIANLWTCLLVCLCVAMTLVDVGGLMYFWGLTIDTVTSINLILAIGLAVDYSAHIGHSFMTEVGTRNDRAHKTLTYIGPAVFYGGFSTFLAFVLLAGSNSYVFITFFRLFFGVVLFGLYHGLVFLPVILSWIGPAPYLSAKERPDTETGVKNENNVNNANGIPLENGVSKDAPLGDEPSSPSKSVTLTTHSEPGSPVKVNSVTPVA